MSKWIRKAKTAVVVADYLRALGHVPTVRPDFSVVVVIDGLTYVIETLAEARRIVG